MLIDEDQAHPLTYGLKTLLQSWRFYLRLVERAISLRRRITNQKSLAAIVEEVVASDYFRSNQKPVEILWLLELLREVRPRYACEIGTSHGGTLFLFCRVLVPNARILSIDLAYPSIEYKRTYCLLKQPGQRLMCLEADSHSQATLQTAQHWFEGHQLDFLFIDGDHSLTGLELDFELFAPLVRPGGIIAFHDISPDYRTRFGQQTIANTGQVPQFWASLKQKGYQTIEFIEYPDQDGCGIGVLFWPGSF